MQELCNFNSKVLRKSERLQPWRDRAVMACKVEVHMQLCFEAGRWGGQGQWPESCPYALYAS